MAKTPRSGGSDVVAALSAHCTQRVYCVPGESYLAVLDALYDARSSIDVISCRHESGAAFMAVAEAMLTGRPGVCLVTRGPGATNASIALHVAAQASVPLVVGVGQVARDHLGREAFQEVDYLQLFGSVVKHVEQINSADQLYDGFLRAFAIAVSGRPGPVVLALPEDVLSDSSSAHLGAPTAPPPLVASVAQVATVASALKGAERPLVLAGGYWSDQDSAELTAFAERYALPVVTSFRRHDLFNNTHALFCGYLGLGTPPAVWQAVEACDCLLVLGARLDEPTTNDYQAFDKLSAAQIFHVHPEATVIGRNYAATALQTSPQALVRALHAQQVVTPSTSQAWCEQLRRTWLEAPPPAESADGVSPARVMAALNRAFNHDAIVTLDAGNFTRWPQRLRQYQRPGRLLAPINGAMGFGVPAAIGAALAMPERQVLACVGDGGMLMTGNELATAQQYGARITLVVFNNNRYGTIEMHQHQRYPERHIGVRLSNPDFAAYAAAFGLKGLRISNNTEIEDALEEALSGEQSSLLEVYIDGY